MQIKMAAEINNVLLKMIDFLFGPIMLAVYFGVGALYTIRLRGVQFSRFGVAFRECVLNISSNNNKGIGQLQSFKALATALSACVGNGNIAGVAGAIAVGGPGAIFWMWVAALLGMATKFAEICLAVHFRVKDAAGNFRGGVMYILRDGLSNKKVGKILGGAFAFFTVFVSLVSCGALQVNTMTSAVLSIMPVPAWLVGGVILALEALVVFKGLGKIADVCTVLAPLMAFVYMGFGSIILVMHFNQIPTALLYIVQSAFTGDAVIGGVAGATMAFAIKKGVSRGVFSNEAGIGSSAIVHATAKVDQPIQESLYGILEVFCDTIIICTFTALIIITSGVWNSGITDGTVLATNAFNQNLGVFGHGILVFSLLLFCFTNVIGWYTYGESAFTFLFGAHSVMTFRVIHCGISFLGCLASVDVMWNAADVCNGLMALPNLFSLLIFSSVVVKDTKSFFADYDAKRAVVKAAQ